jgi:hypothetical protein
MRGIAVILGGLLLIAAHQLACGVCSGTLACPCADGTCQHVACGDNCANACSGREGEQNLADGGNYCTPRPDGG